MISKTDLVSSEEVSRLNAIIKTLNTDAKVIPISNGEVDVNEVLNTGKFDFEKAQQSPGWLKEMRGEHIPETEEYGISSFSYEARRPFHPAKFHSFLHNTNQFGKLIRSKGYFWLASDLNMLVSGVKQEESLVMVLLDYFGKQSLKRTGLPKKYI